MGDSLLKLFSGSSNPELAEEIARYLNMELSKVELNRFKDGEISVKIKENVRGHDVFIVQSTCNPTNDHVIELLLMIDAALRASAGILAAAAVLTLVHVGVSRLFARRRTPAAPDE